MIVIARCFNWRTHSYVMFSVQSHVCTGLWIVYYMILVNSWLKFQPPLPLPEWLSKQGRWLKFRLVNIALRVALSVTFMCKIYQSKSWGIQVVDYGSKACVRIWKEQDCFCSISGGFSIRSSNCIFVKICHTVWINLWKGGWWNLDPPKANKIYK